MASEEPLGQFRVVGAGEGVEVCQRAAQCPECGGWDGTCFWPDETWGQYHCTSCGADFREEWGEPDAVVEVGLDGGRPSTVTVRDGDGRPLVEVTVHAGEGAEAAASRALSMTRLGKVEAGASRVVGFRVVSGD